MPAYGASIDTEIAGQDALFRGAAVGEPVTWGALTQGMVRPGRRGGQARQGGSGRFGSAPIDAEPDYGRSREKAAEAFDVSRRFVDRATVVLK